MFYFTPNIVFIVLKYVKFRPFKIAHLNQPEYQESTIWMQQLLEKLWLETPTFFRIQNLPFLTEFLKC